MPTRRRNPALLLLLLVVSPVASPAAPPTATAPARPANRLAGETSPYLLAHAHNPVDWYPWGAEAFAKARAESKPVFLSVGYSACYWCHVMERECFEDPAIARRLNEGFVCVKVDREERPDVDQVYMTALQVFGNGGWPMSMFLTPDGRPFFGGTYFPPADRDGMEGFPTLLGRVAAAWRDKRAEVLADADRLADVVRRTSAGQSLKRKAPLSGMMAADGQAALRTQFDPEFGGFGYSPENARRPKFPEPVNLLFLLDRHRRGAGDLADGPAAGKGPPDLLGMALVTMDRMARGGVRDQLAGGYHRYSTVRDWSVPHFEKMLYDNAQLASAHLAAFELTRDRRWADEAAATLDFVARSMAAPDGGFISALDAETGGEEGAYYVWTREEVRAALGDGPDAEAFARVYGLDGAANFEGGRYVLREPRTRADQAAALKLTPEALEARLAPTRAKLLEARDRRPAPRRDDKVLTSWNGLMIAAYADGFRLLRDERYRRAADSAADFLLAKLRTPDGRLLRTYRVGRAKVPGYLDDYAFLAHGLLRLHAATGEPRRLEQARALTDRMLADFTDPADGGFFYTAEGHEALISRPRDPIDGVLPGGNSVAVRDLVALAALTGEARYLDAAGRTLGAFSARLSQAPGSVPLLLLGLQEFLDARPQADAATAAAAVVPDPLDPAAKLAARAEPADPAWKPTPGGEFDAVVSLTVKPGWHAYANPTGLAGVPPTRLTLEPGHGATLVRVDYPAGVTKDLAANGPERVALYEGTVRLRARVRLDPAAKSVPAALGFVLHYQVCDDRACLAPARLRVGLLLPGSPE